MKCPICKDKLIIKGYETPKTFKKRITCGKFDCKREYRIRARIGFHAPAWGRWNMKYL